MAGESPDIAPDDPQRFSVAPERSSLDHAGLSDALSDWFRRTVVDDAARISGLSQPSGSGMSSESLLFDATWSNESGKQEAALVARLAPDAGDVPIFPVYDMELQARVLTLVAENSTVPVPRVRWLELDSAVIGTPFFVMDRAMGRVPIDIPPYVFEGWLLEASDSDRRTLQDGSVEVLAQLHNIDLSDLDTSFLDTRSSGESPLRRHLQGQREFYDWTRGDRHHPVIDDAFAWLEANWPEEGPAVISWGDSRIGNIMYELDGFEPVAVFDWEMASLAPAEVDLGWMAFFHTFFQDIAEVFGLVGLPDFMRDQDVVDTYEARRGVGVGDLHWFKVYAALRHGIIMSRIRARSVHFGEATWPDDVDEVIPHRDRLHEWLA